MLVEIENPDWDHDPLRLEGWEPWEDYEDEREVENGGCAYCGTFDDIRENPEPFGGQCCCEQCFLILIGDDVSDVPWRCGGIADGLLPAVRVDRHVSERGAVTAQGVARMGLRDEGGG